MRRFGNEPISAAVCLRQTHIRYLHQKESPLFPVGFQSIFYSDYAGEIASTGQTSAQEPQSVQSPPSIL